jgi:hypothetical protein
LSFHVQGTVSRDTLEWLLKVQADKGFTHRGLVRAIIEQFRREYPNAEILAGGTK